MVINKLGKDAGGRHWCAAIEDKVLEVNNVTNGNQWMLIIADRYWIVSVTKVMLCHYFSMLGKTSYTS